MEVVTAGDTCKGVVLVFDGVGEVLRHTAQEVGRLFVIVECCHEWECINKHSHGVPHLDITSAVRHGNDRYQVFAYVTSKCDEACTEIDSSRRNAVFLGKCLDCLNVCLGKHALLEM